MWIAKNNDLIILTASTKKQLEQSLKFMVYTSIEETQTEYELVDGSYITPEEAATKREIDFKAEFFEIPFFGFFRKVPKGYSSAVESLNTAFNAVSILQKLPAGMLIFYQEPDYTKPEECTEEWLVQHQTTNAEMSVQQFGEFYMAFMTAWNTEMHETEAIAEGIEENAE